MGIIARFGAEGARLLAGAIKSGSNGWEPMNLCRLASKGGAGAADDEGLVESVGGFGVAGFDPVAGVGEEACEFVGVVGHELGGGPGMVEGDVAVVPAALGGDFTFRDAEAFL